MRLLFVLSVTLLSSGLLADHALSSTSKYNDSVEILSNPRFDSQYLLKAGQRNVDFFYDQISERNDELYELNAGYELKVIDARDPRLYNYNFPFQPRTPATRAIVRVDEVGRWQLAAWIWEGRRTLKVKYPNGALAFSLQYGVRRLEYEGGSGATLARVVRNTTGAGWNYLFYLHGAGHAVTPQMFDHAVYNFVRAAVWRF